MYTTAWLTGYKEFIGWWLLVKVGSGWIWQVHWSPKGRVGKEKPQEEIKIKNQDEEIEPEPGAAYNGYLIGNLLCIIFGVLGALIIQYWAK